MVKTRDRKERTGPKVRAPNGAYFLTFRSIQRTAKNNANIRFEWINGNSIVGLPTIIHPKTGKVMRRNFSPKSGRKGAYVYPTITVRITQGGTL